MNIKISGRVLRIPKWLVMLWPQVPLAVVLGFVGVLDILDGLNVSVKAFEQVRALTGLAGSMSALGHTAQFILGLLLVLAGIGLLWRLVSAWTMSVLLLVVTIGVSVAQKRWGMTIALEAILLVWLFLAKRYFTRRTILASFLFSIGGIVAVLAYGTIGSYLFRTEFRPHIENWNEAFYYTIVTLSTVGYGDIVPDTTETRWFAMSLLVVGLGVFASAIASVLGPKISGELQRMFNPKEKAMELKDHVILVGEGAIARNTAKELKRREVPFVQIVASEAEAVGDTEHQIIEGDATDDAVLRQVNIHRARMVIAAREDDGENAFIALVAKDLNPNVKLLAVASTALAIKRLKLARADLVFSPAAVGSRLLADLVEGNQISPAFQDLLEGALQKT